MLRSQAKGDGVFSSHPWDCQLFSNTNIEELWQEVKLSIYHPKPLPGLSLLAKINIFIFFKWETLNRKYVFGLDEEGLSAL